MRLDQALFKIRNSGLSAFRTSDIGAICSIRNDYACHIAGRLAQSGHLIGLKRDLWCFSDRADPMLIPVWLTAPFPSYISLQTALYHHGMISQMPVVNYSISLARTRLFNMPAGAFSIHHIGEDFFTGFDTDQKTGIMMAGPEKALLDFLYLGPAKSRIFASLPELEFPRAFSQKKAGNFIKAVSSKQRRTLLERRFEETLNRYSD